MVMMNVNESKMSVCMSVCLREKTRLCCCHLSLQPHVFEAHRTDTIITVIDLYANYTTLYIRIPLFHRPCIHPLVHAFIVNILFDATP
jgi:hypothetical protein